MTISDIARMAGAVSYTHLNARNEAAHAGSPEDAQEAARIYADAIDCLAEAYLDAAFIAGAALAGRRCLLPGKILLRFPGILGQLLSLIHI